MDILREAFNIEQEISPIGCGEGCGGGCGRGCGGGCTGSPNTQRPDEQA